MEYIVPQKIKNAYMQNKAINGNIRPHMHLNIHNIDICMCHILKKYSVLKQSKFLKNEMIIPDKKK